jgi:hypothetical protein
MRRCIRKLSLFAGLALTLHLSLSTPLRAQQSEDNDSPKFLEVSPADSTVVALSEVTITGRVEVPRPNHAL